MSALLSFAAACGADEESTGLTGTSLTPDASMSPSVVAEGRRIFRFDTFGNETFWSDTAALHVKVNGLSPQAALLTGLKVDVDAYAMVISLMAAQGIGGATLLRDTAATGVAVGSAFFLLSDALLAIYRFAQPLPMAAFWVLSTYYVAQFLIVRNSRPASLSAPAPAYAWRTGSSRAI